jgi:acetyl esterase/lipase
MRQTFRILSIALALAFTTCAPAQQVLPLWAAGTPEPAHTKGSERTVTTPTDRLVAGRPILFISDVSKPSLAFYAAPSANNTGVAVLVFPGGSYLRLAYDLEGTEVCTWLNGLGINCIIVKYRVPEEAHYPASVEDLEDAQQAMRLTRSHASEWHIDPKRIGVLGFSAGAHLAVVLGNHPTFSKTGAPISPLADVDARPNFVTVIYPGYISSAPALKELSDGIDPSSTTPPTFLLQAADDPVHVENVLLYARALKDLHVPVELHVYSEGGHGYGMRPTNLPVTHWPDLVATWLRTIHVLNSN